MHLKPGDKVRQLPPHTEVEGTVVCADYPNANSVLVKFDEQPEGSDVRSWQDAFPNPWYVGRDTLTKQGD